MNSNICITKIYWTKFNFTSECDFKSDEDKNKHLLAPCERIIIFRHTLVVLFKTSFINFFLPNFFQNESLHDVDRRQSLGQLYVWSLLMSQSGDNIIQHELEQHESHKCNNNYAYRAVIFEHTEKSFRNCVNPYQT